MEVININQADDIQSIEATPLSRRLQNLPLTTYQLLKQSSERAPNQTFITHLNLPESNIDSQPTSYTYAQFFKRVNRLARAFLNLGVEGGDVVSFVLPNLPETAMCEWAAEAIGVANPINPFLRTEQITRLFHAAKPKLIVTLGSDFPEIWEKVSSARDQYNPQTKILVIGGVPEKSQHCVDYFSIIQTQADAPLTRATTKSGNQACAYFHTSESTGEPKLASISHSAKIYMAWAMTCATHGNPQEVQLLGLPMFHVAAPCMLTQAAMTTSQAIIMTPVGWMNPAVIENFWPIVEQFKATTTAALPFTYEALMQTHTSKIKSSLRYVISGMPMPSQAAEEFEKLTQAKVMNIYGLTESTCIVAATPLQSKERPALSCGLALPYQQVKIAQLDAQGNFLRECDTGETGVILVKGPNISPRYLTETSYTAFPLEGWLNTQDIGMLNSQGWLQVLGRQADLIQLDTQYFSPLAAEEILQQHPQVERAAIIAHNDKIIACITLSANAKGINKQEILHWLQQQHVNLPINALPLTQIKQLAVIEHQHMRLSGTGKVIKPYLRQHYQNVILSKDVVNI
jgi:fatty-acyl-CoA synthase